MLRIFDVAASGMSAETVRLNTIASNLANANSLSGDPQGVYRARHPVFAAMLDRARGESGPVGVRTLGIVERPGEPEKLYDPANPLADTQGYVFRSAIDPIEEMANMMSASRAFQNNVEVLNTVKQLMLSTIRLGQ